jgi:hypothetical protein
MLIGIRITSDARASEAGLGMGAVSQGSGALVILA